MGETRSLRLSTSAIPAADGPILLTLEHEQLRAEYRDANGVCAPMNPFTFGAYFNFRGMSGEKLEELRSFLESTGFQPELYPSRFPLEQQLAVIEEYLQEELNAKLLPEQITLFCNLFEQLYPAFWRFMVNKNSCILYDGFYGYFLATAYLEFHSASSYEELVEQVFGVARKDSLRESRKMDAIGLSLAFMFKGILPIEQMLPALVTPETSSLDFPVKPELYGALLKLSPAHRLKLFQDVYDSQRELEPWVIEDVLELLAMLPDEYLKKMKGATKWSSLHERLMRYCDAIEGVNIVTIPEPLKFAPTAFEEYELRSLQRAKEFAVLGDYLNICIGKAGYYRKALRGETYCFAGWEEGKPTFALEVTRSALKWKVIQLSGYKNSTVPNAKQKILSIERLLNGSSS